MKQVLTTAQTTGSEFRGTGGDTLLFVNHDTGSNIEIEALEPKEIATEFDAYAAWSTNATFTATEVSAGTEVTVTEPTDEDFGILIPTTTGADNQFQGFAVPSSKTIRSIRDEDGTDQLSDFTAQTGTITIGGVTYQVWVSSVVRPIARAGSTWRLIATDDDNWIDVSMQSVGRADINTDGHWSFATSPEMEYRLNPAAAGSAAWLVEPTYVQRHYNG